MDKEKISELKGWLREAKHKECEKYMAIAINDKHHMVAAVDSDHQSMFEMLPSSPHKTRPSKRS